MTWEETKELVKKMRGTYIKYFQNFTDNEYKNMVDSWTLYLKDFTYDQAIAGLVDWATSKSDGFPPDPAQLIRCIRGIMNPSIAEMTGIEAWTMVRAAIRNSAYNSVESFNALPETVKRAVGSPAVLREWGQQSSDVVTDHIQSRFLRQYEECVRKKHEYETLHSDVKALVDRVLEEKRNGMQQVPGTGANILLQGSQRSEPYLRGKENASLCENVPGVSWSGADRACPG